MLEAIRCEKLNSSKIVIINGRHTREVFKIRDLINLIIYNTNKILFMFINYNIYT